MGLEEEDAIETERGDGELLPARVQTAMPVRKWEFKINASFMYCIIFDELD